jgi:hypothetical protein
MSALVRYNRLWQGEIARLPDSYRAANALKDEAIERQSLMDSMASGDEKFRTKAQPRVDSLTRRLNEAMRKNPSPSFVRVDHPAPNKWVVTVPLFTDIADSLFVERAREAIEQAWHVRDGDDEFSLVLDLKRVRPADLYPGAEPPALGAHIDVGAHVNRFPPGGTVMTTGGNNTYALGRGIIIGPGTLPRATLVHEFSHMLGFRDSYFRSFEDRGADGFAVLEVILDPDDVLVVPERGVVRRGHFEEVIRELSK